MCYLKYQHDLFAYDVVWFSDILLQEFIWIDLAHALMIFYFRIVISLSCPIQCYFVALHDYDRYLD